MSSARFTIRRVQPDSQTGWRDGATLYIQSGVVLRTTPSAIGQQVQITASELAELGEYFETPLDEPSCLVGLTFSGEDLNADDALDEILVGLRHQKLGLTYEPRRTRPDSTSECSDIYELIAQSLAKDQAAPDLGLFEHWFIERAMWPDLVAPIPGGWARWIAKRIHTLNPKLNVRVKAAGDKRWVYSIIELTLVQGCGFWPRWPNKVWHVGILRNGNRPVRILPNH